MLISVIFDLTANSIVLTVLLMASCSNKQTDSRKEVPGEQAIRYSLYALRRGSVNAKTGYRKTSMLLGAANGKYCY